MPLPPTPDVEELAAALAALCRAGAQPPTLLNEPAGALLDLLTDPADPPVIRADTAYRLLLAALTQLDRADAHASGLLLHVGNDRGGRRPPPLAQRRRVAADVYGVTEESFRKHVQPDVFKALAVALIRAHMTRLRNPTRRQPPGPNFSAGPIRLTRPDAPRHLGPTTPDPGPAAPPPPWPTRP